MDGPTSELLRDGSFALVALAAVLGALRRGSRLDALLDPAAALSGVVGAFCMEALMLRHPALTRNLWERPWVQAVGLAGTAVVGRSLTRGRGERAAAAVCWGLLAYLGLAGVVITGRRNPVAALGEYVGRAGQS